MKNNTLVTLLFLVFFIFCLFQANAIEKVKVVKEKIVFVNGYQRQVILKTIPRKTRSFEFNNCDYFCHQGNYFIKDSQMYLQTVPPVGLQIASLSEGYEKTKIDDTEVYYLNGFFYLQKPDKDCYTVINGPIGIKVKTIPENSVKVKIDEKDYLVYFDMIFKVLHTHNQEAYILTGYIDK